MAKCITSIYTNAQTLRERNNGPFSSGGQKWALTGVIHGNMHVIVLSYTFTEKHVCFDVISLFSAHFWPHWKRIHYCLIICFLVMRLTLVRSSTWHIAVPVNCMFRLIMQLLRSDLFPRPLLWRKTLVRQCLQLWNVVWTREMSLHFSLLVMEQQWVSRLIT